MTIPFLPLIGIDIGSSAVKIAEIGGRRNKRKLQALGLELLPAAAVTDGAIQDIEAVETAIMNLLENMKINPAGRRAAISLPPSVVEIKRVLVDTSKGEVAELINYEAEQHFQNDIGEMYFKYQELPGWSEDPEKIPVLIVGAMREPVDQLIALIRSCGMRTGIVDCEALCLSNAFEFSNPSPETLTAVVDIGTHVSIVTLVHNGHMLFTKTLHLGGIEYSRQIMQNLAIEMDLAETMKIAASQGQVAMPEPMQRVVADLNQTLANEVHETLKHYFENSMPIPGVNGLTQAFLTGGGARLHGLEAVISATLQVPVSVMNPFLKVQVNPRKFELDYILGQGHVYSVAVGLALRSMGDDAA